jgi:hypothetical protein
MSECPVFFRLSPLGDSFDFTAWVRRGPDLWRVSLRKPEFEPEKLDGRNASFKVTFDANGAPQAIATPHGVLSVTASERHPALVSSGDAPVSVLDLGALPERFREEVDLELARGERIRWWGSPGRRALLRPTILLGAVAIGVVAFTFAWLRGTALCFSDATPEQWRFPCGAMAVAGLAMLVGVLFAVARMWWRALRLQVRTLYLVTDVRAIAFFAVGAGRFVSIPADEIRFTRVERGKDFAHFLFPTRDGDLNGFWAVHECAPAEAALARLAQ